MVLLTAYERKQGPNGVNFLTNGFWNFLTVFTTHSPAITTSGTPKSTSKVVALRESDQIGIEVQQHGKGDGGTTSNNRPVKGSRGKDKGRTSTSDTSNNTKGGSSSPESYGSKTRSSPLKLTYKNLTRLASPDSAEKDGAEKKTRKTASVDDEKKFPSPNLEGGGSTVTPPDSDASDVVAANKTDSVTVSFFKSQETTETSGTGTSTTSRLTSNMNTPTILTVDSSSQNNNNNTSRSVPLSEGRKPSKETHVSINLDSHLTERIGTKSLHKSLSAKLD